MVGRNGQIGASAFPLPVAQSSPHKAYLQLQCASSAVTALNSSHGVEMWSGCEAQLAFHPHSSVICRVCTCRRSHGVRGVSAGGQVLAVGGKLRRRRQCRWRGRAQSQLRVARQSAWILRALGFVRDASSRRSLRSRVFCSASDDSERGFARVPNDNGLGWRRAVDLRHQG